MGSLSVFYFKKKMFVVRMCVFYRLHANNNKSFMILLRKCFRRNTLWRYDVGMCRSICNMLSSCDATPCQNRHQKVLFDTEFNFNQYGKKENDQNIVK